MPLGVMQARAVCHNCRTGAVHRGAGAIGRAQLSVACPHHAACVACPPSPPSCVEGSWISSSCSSVPRAQLKCSREPADAGTVKVGPLSVSIADVRQCARFKVCHPAIFAFGLAAITEDRGETSRRWRSDQIHTGLKATCHVIYMAWLYGARKCSAIASSEARQTAKLATH